MAPCKASHGFCCFCDVIVDFAFKDVVDLGDDVDDEEVDADADNGDCVWWPRNEQSSVDFCLIEESEGEEYKGEEEVEKKAN